MSEKDEHLRSFYEAPLAWKKQQVLDHVNLFDAISTRMKRTAGPRIHSHSVEPHGNNCESSRNREEHGTHDDTHDEDEDEDLDFDLSMIDSLLRDSDSEEESQAAWASLGFSSNTHYEGDDVGAEQEEEEEDDDDDDSYSSSFSSSSSSPSSAAGEENGLDRDRRMKTPRSERSSLAETDEERQERISRALALIAQETLDPVDVAEAPDSNQSSSLIEQECIRVDEKREGICSPHREEKRDEIEEISSLYTANTDDDSIPRECHSNTSDQDITDGEEDRPGLYVDFPPHVEEQNVNSTCLESSLSAYAASLHPGSEMNELDTREDVDFFESRNVHHEVSNREESLDDTDSDTSMNSPRRREADFGLLVSSSDTKNSFRSDHPSRLESPVDLSPNVWTPSMHKKRNAPVVGVNSTHNETPNKLIEAQSSAARQSALNTTRHRSRVLQRRAREKSKLKQEAFAALDRLTNQIRDGSWFCKEAHEQNCEWTGTKLSDGGCLSHDMDEPDHGNGFRGSLSLSSPVEDGFLHVVPLRRNERTRYLPGFSIVSSEAHRRFAKSNEDSTTPRDLRESRKSKRLVSSSSAPVSHPPSQRTFPHEDKSIDDSPSRTLFSKPKRDRYRSSPSAQEDSEKSLLSHSLDGMKKAQETGQKRSRSSRSAIAGYFDLQDSCNRIKSPSSMNLPPLRSRSVLLPSLASCMRGSPDQSANNSKHCFDQSNLNGSYPDGDVQIKNSEFRRAIHEQVRSTSSRESRTRVSKKAKEKSRFSDVNLRSRYIHEVERHFCGYSPEDVNSKVWLWIRGRLRKLVESLRATVAERSQDMTSVLDVWSTPHLSSRLIKKLSTAEKLRIQCERRLLRELHIVAGILWSSHSSNDEIDFDSFEMIGDSLRASQLACKTLFQDAYALLERRMDTIHP